MSATEARRREHTLLTIGAVCGRLKDEFPDISISKIRYLEDQGLLTPKRTRGGYRLFSEDDVDRLRRILELQRDEFLPLRVIRQELAAPSAKERRRRRGGTLVESEDELDLGALCERAGIKEQFARELEEFGLLTPRVGGGERFYTETDAGIAAACARLAQYGISARHLRTFRTAADRETGLVEALVAPSLRSRNPERREEALRELAVLGDAAQELGQLLFWRDLKELAAR